MKKKLVGLMLSGMLVLSLAACGGDDAAADSTTVSTQAEVSTTSDTVAEEVTTEEVTEGFNLLGFLHKLFFS